MPIFYIATSLTHNPQSANNVIQVPSNVSTLLPLVSDTSLAMDIITIHYVNYRNLLLAAHACGVILSVLPSMRLHH